MSKEISAILAEIRKVKEELAHGAVERPGASKLAIGQQSGKYLGLQMAEEIISNVLRDVEHRNAEF